MDPTSDIYITRYRGSFGSATLLLDRAGHTSAARDIAAYHDGKPGRIPLEANGFLEKRPRHG
jgi:hypothetical protein